MPVADSRANASHRRTVLLVEDDEQIAQGLCAVLEDAGYAIALASNGVEALDRLHAKTVDAIVLDLMLPVMDGWEFVSAQKANQMLAGIPVIVISADHSAKARAIRADRELKKPFAAQQLLAALDELLFALDRKALAARIEEAEDRFLCHLRRDPTSVVASRAQGDLRSLGFALQQLRLACRAAASPGEIGRLHRSVDLLLTSAPRVSTGRSERPLAPPPERWAWVELVRLVDDCVTHAQAGIGRRVNLVRAYGEVGRVWTDEHALRHACAGILACAVSSIRGQAPHQVVVSIERDADCVTVEVRDTGGGMWRTEGENQTALPASEHQPSLRECSELIEALGGSMHLESSVGHGSACRLRLPRAVQPRVVPS